MITCGKIFLGAWLGCFAFTPLALAASAAAHHPAICGGEAQQLISALVYGNETLFDRVFHDKASTIKIEISDLDVSATTGKQGYEPEDSLFALPSAMASGRLPGITKPVNFHTATCLFEIFHKQDITPDTEMGYTHFRVKTLSCQIERGFEDPDKRFSCHYKIAE